MKLSYPKPLNLRRDFKCLNCERRTESQGIFKVKYRDIIRGWTFDHFEDEKKINSEPTQETPDNNVQHLGKRVINHRSNIDLVFRGLFNEDERENYYSGFGFFKHEEKHENFNNLVEIRKNYGVPLIIKKLNPHIRSKIKIKYSF